MKKMIKPILKKNNELKLKIYTLKDKIKLDWSQWNIVYIPEEIKPKEFKNKTLIISSLAHPKRNETFLEFMKRISNCNLVFVLEGSKIIHIDELKSSFQKGIVLNGTTKLHNNLS